MLAYAGCPGKEVVKWVSGVLVWLVWVDCDVAVRQLQWSSASYLKSPVADKERMSPVCVFV